MFDFIFSLVKMIVIISTSMLLAIFFILLLFCWIIRMGPRGEEDFLSPPAYEEGKPFTFEYIV